LPHSVIRSTLIRMNSGIRQFAVVALALFAGSAVAAGLAHTAESDRPKVAIVVAGQAAEQPAVVERARRLASDTGAQLRVPRTSADQLGVTHVLAASGYDEVITIGVDRRVAIDPVAARYPDTRFVESSANAIDQ
jgi:basic membrane lipoprotein Med (substrate-binding protein (PBP1-ABC) superfamily)